MNFPISIVGLTLATGENLAISRVVSVTISKLPSFMAVGVTVISVTISKLPSFMAVGITITTGTLDNQAAVAMPAAVPVAVVAVGVVILTGE